MSVLVDDLPGATTTVAPSDLRLVDPARALAHASATLGVRIRPEGLLRKRRTVSGPTDAGTWLRVEAKSDECVTAQGWGGIEAAAALRGVAKPGWYRSLSWHDDVHRVWWRADEIELVADPAIKPGGLLRTDPNLGDDWWATLRSSLRELAAHPAPRAAKFDDGVLTTERVQRLVTRTATALDLSPRLAAAPVTQWSSAHADLSWANLTGPRCWLLDWEDWGAAPRGFDAAWLLLESLAMPALADRVRAEFTAELTSDSGRLSVLALAAPRLTDPGREDEIAERVEREARHAAAALLG